MAPELLRLALDVHGPAGLRLVGCPVPQMGGCTQSAHVGPGTPSLVAALDAPIDRQLGGTRIRLHGPDGPVLGPSAKQGVAVATRHGGAVAITVLDPTEGKWTVHVEQAEASTAPRQVRLLCTPFEDPAQALQAATAHVDLHAQSITLGVPLELVPFLAPVARALQPLAGTALDVDDATHAVPVVAASDLTGAHPDDIAHAIASLYRDAPAAVVLEALAGAAVL